jgi:hypothetical protein
MFEAGVDAQVVRDSTNPIGHDCSVIVVEAPNIVVVTSLFTTVVVFVARILIDGVGSCTTTLVHIITAGFAFAFTAWDVALCFV